MKYKLLIFICAVFAAISLFAGELAAINNFNSSTVFPTWGEETPSGIIGNNGENLKSGGSRLILYFIPRIIDLLLILVSPIIAVMFIFSGIRFIYAGDNDDQLEESKKFFHYAIMGVVFVVLSYSIMKSVYYLLS